MPSKITSKRLRLSAAVALAAVAAPAAFAAHTVLGEVSYAEQIQPIFDEYCVSCHNPEGEGFKASGLDLRTYEGAMQGTSHGAVIVPGDAFTSNLMVLVEGRADPSISMPHNAKRDLSTGERVALRRWINEGATEEGYKKVEPIVKSYCLVCHMPGGMGHKASGLDMRTYADIMKGTAHGPVVVPGNAEISNLMVLVEGRAGKGLKMPHNPVPSPNDHDKVLLRRWIQQGAKNN